MTKTLYGTKCIPNPNVICLFVLTVCVSLRAYQSSVKWGKTNSTRTASSPCVSPVRFPGVTAAMSRLLFADISSADVNIFISVDS